MHQQHLRMESSGQGREGLLLDTVTPQCACGANWAPALCRHCWRAAAAMGFEQALLEALLGALMSRRRHFKAHDAPRPSSSYWA